MQFTIREDSDQLLRIGGGGAEAVVYRGGQRAQLLSILVPEPDRRRGIGRALLGAVAQEAYRRGVRSLHADLIERLSDVKGLLGAYGFVVGRGRPVVSMEMEELLTREKVRRALETDLPEYRFISFWEFQLMRPGKLDRFYSSPSIPYWLQDPSRLQPDMSGVVFEEKRHKAVAMAACSERGDSLHVDLLQVRSGKRGEGDMIAALQGMMREVVAEGGPARFRTITFFPARIFIRRSIEMALGLEMNGVAEQTVHASKKLEGPGEGMELAKDPSGGDRGAWRQALAEIPYQENINFKCAWQGGR